jgi:hypothetical protein
MSNLHDFIPEPRVREHDEVTTLAASAHAFEAARHFDLARSGFVHALFWLRTLPERMGAGDGQVKLPNLQLDMIGRGEEGFMVLEDSSERLVVGAIGRFWQPHIEFAQVDASQFATFSEPGWGKVAWQLSCEPAFGGSRISFDLAVNATDDAAWRKLARYYGVIGPFSRLIRRRELRMIARDLDAERDRSAQPPLAGDDWVTAPKLCLNHEIEIAATPQAVWPWLVQMGCRRAGWYSYDVLDNGGELSAFSVIPEFQQVGVGDVLPATPEGHDGFTVLQLDAPRALVLGGLFDAARDSSLPMTAAKPEQYTQVSWAFVLDPIAEASTRLRVRVRADYAPDQLAARSHAHLLTLVHHFMESEQLKNLKARAEGHAVPPMASPADLVEAGVGALGIAFNLATPFLRGVRCHWGLTATEAQRDYPGDRLVPAPRWQWTHALEVAASASEIWPWIAQLGQDKGGFYSYQMLENLVGCEIHNAGRVHSEWQATKPGDALRLHPKMPPLEIREVVPDEYLLACAGLDPSTGLAPDRRSEQPYFAASWLFQLEALANGHTRVISRYRCDCSSDLATWLAYGPYITEAVGFVMDRRMLLGIQERVERERSVQGAA